MIKVEDIFENLRENSKNGVIEIKNAKENGAKVVGTYCVFTPWEVIAAAGGIPATLCSTNESTIPDAEKVLPRNLCPLIKSSYGFAITDKCPYFSFSDLVIGETTCDGKKKMYEYLGRIKPMHIMQLPQTIEREEDFEMWRREVVCLKERLEKEFGVTITDEKLREQIKIRNEERNALKDFASLSKLTPPAIYGEELQLVFNHAKTGFDKERVIKELKEMTQTVKEAYENGERRVSGDRPRILITGCPMGGAVEKVIKIIEEEGGVVVCYENCSGIKEKQELIDEGKDPIDAIAEKYLKVPCSCTSPNKNRMDLLETLIDEYKADGVIDVILQACHTYNVESFSVKEVVKGNKKIPYMNIETDYSQNDLGQLKTRISAFIEMM
ncbi:MAG: double-cubane-cluster-containing anaerobic reductase [Marinisporobacter sp.]|jgi:benzoyl-CoA reductase/2-hydroxyglutaryl-CoA dehydratase subunit BcrC/BadD/HgdB|nr:double-cubane-cluster-containing anaerobic reductase [Marinisporobacter sp.]